MGQGAINFANCPMPLEGIALVVPKSKMPMSWSGFYSRSPPTSIDSAFVVFLIATLSLTPGERFMRLPKDFDEKSNLHAAHIPEDPITLLYYHNTLYFPVF